MADQKEDEQTMADQDVLVTPNPEGRAPDKRISVMAPELIQAARREGLTINVNVLLERVAANAQDPREALELSRQALVLAKEWEDHALTAFKARSDIVIDFEQRNPKEIELRKNAGVRRILKVTTAACAIVGLGGGVACVVLNAATTITLAILAIGVVGVVLLGPMSTDQPITIEDVVEGLRAIIKRSENKGAHEEQDRARAKRKRG